MLFLPSHPHLFQVAQFAVIRNRIGAALLLKRKDGTYRMPGGAVKIGEPWHESLARAVREDTGFVGLKVHGILEVDSWAEHGETFYAATFACSVPEFEELYLKKEGIGHAWAILPTLAAFEFDHPKTRERLTRILAEAPHPLHS